jgi:arginyl-tRNA--protein-N-Asp/Glu arginylyltransferase
VREPSGRVLRHFVEAPRPCSYLPSAAAALEYKLMVDVSPTEFEAMLLRGWRRFGPAYFRPACSGCGECVSIRVDVRRFTPSESQRRALRRTRRFLVELTRPRIDEARVALHEQWHRTREQARGWGVSALSEDEYATQFAFPSKTGRELAWYDGERLVGLSLIDVTPNCVSAAYFFYAPSIARLSPGIGNVLRCVDLARELGATHVYLGYRVLGCASLEYKQRFHPHELLSGRPAPTEEPQWSDATVT